MNDHLPSMLAEAIAPPFGTLPAFMRMQAGLRPDHVALIQGERRVEWGEFDVLVDRVAATLQRHGLAPREVIAICAANSIEYVVTFLGALRAGIAVTPLAPTATAESLDLMLRDSGAKFLFLDATAGAALATLSGLAGLSRVAQATHCRNADADPDEAARPARFDYEYERNERAFRQRQVA